MLAISRFLGCRLPSGPFQGSPSVARRNPGNRLGTRAHERPPSGSSRQPWRCRSDTGRWWPPLAREPQSGQGQGIRSAWSSPRKGWQAVPACLDLGWPELYYRACGHESNGVANPIRHSGDQGTASLKLRRGANSSTRKLARVPKVCPGPGQSAAGDRFQAHAGRLDRPHGRRPRWLEPGFRVESPDTATRICDMKVMFSNAPSLDGSAHGPQPIRNPET